MQLESLKYDMRKGMEILEMVYYGLCQDSEIQEDLSLHETAVEIKRKLEQNFGLSFRKWAVFYLTNLKS